MKAKVIVTEGGAWGDEGKGKVSTFYSRGADLTIRATGGANAGHTVHINEVKTANHLVPGGIGYENVMCLIGKGTLIELEVFFNELEEMIRLGVKDAESRIRIDNMANVLLPCHKVVERLQDWFRENPIGTTGRGMGPGFGDATTRFGIKVEHLLLPIEDLTRVISEVFAIHRPLINSYEKWLDKKEKSANKKEKEARCKEAEARCTEDAKKKDELLKYAEELRKVAKAIRRSAWVQPKEEKTQDRKKEKKPVFTESEWVVVKEMFDNPEEVAKTYKLYGLKLEYLHMVVDGFKFVSQYKNDPEKTIVVEGAQSISLSITEGHYPMVTSSDANTLGTLAGANLNHKDPTEVVVIFKAYFSKVGNGAFVTEMPSHIDSEGKLIPYDEAEVLEGDIYREELNEYGATTHRPRRIGHFDAVHAKTAVEKAGGDYLCINCIDSIGLMGQKMGCLKICCSYEFDDGSEIDYCPQTFNITGEIPKPRYIEIEGGWTITKDMTTYESLPAKAKQYIETIEELVGCKAKYIGIGPKNEDLIVRNDL